MMTSKFIGHFLEEISGWQKTLCTVDTVITLWMDVQRTWSPHQRLIINHSSVAAEHCHIFNKSLFFRSHLESIFIGSEDIRKQLPVDSVR